LHQWRWRKVWFKRDSNREKLAVCYQQEAEHAEIEVTRPSSDNGTWGIKLDSDLKTVLSVQAAGLAAAGGVKAGYVLTKVDNVSVKKKVAAVDKVPGKITRQERVVSVVQEAHTMTFERRTGHPVTYKWRLVTGVQWVPGRKNGTFVIESARGKGGSDTDYWTLDIPTAAKRAELRQYLSEMTREISPQIPFVDPSLKRLWKENRRNKVLDAFRSREDGFV
jgi:hypothetical protein